MLAWVMEDLCISPTSVADCCCSVTKLCLTLCDPMDLQHARLPCPPLSPRVCSNSHPLSQWCHPTISSAVIPSPPALSLSQHLGLSHDLTLHQVAKVWSFSFSISSSDESSRLISFMVDWFDLLAIQGTLKSLLQLQSLKGSILWHSACFVAQLSHSYMTVGKTIALIIGPLSAKWCLCFLICCLGLW